MACRSPRRQKLRVSATGPRGKPASEQSRDWNWRAERVGRRRSVVCYILPARSAGGGGARNSGVKLLHAVLTDISKQLEWAGAKRDTETWKRPLVAAWLRARGEALEMLSAIDGHGADIVFRRTSKLTRAERAHVDKLAAAFKAGRDGLADALGIDDARFRIHPYLHTSVAGKVVVRLTPKADAGPLLKGLP